MQLVIFQFFNLPVAVLTQLAHTTRYTTYGRLIPVPNTSVRGLAYRVAIRSAYPWVLHLIPNARRLFLLASAVRSGSAGRMFVKLWRLFFAVCRGTSGARRSRNHLSCRRRSRNRNYDDVHLKHYSNTTFTLSREKSSRFMRVTPIRQDIANVLMSKFVNLALHWT